MKIVEFKICEVCKKEHKRKGATCGAKCGAVLRWQKRKAEELRKQTEEGLNSPVNRYLRGKYGC